MGTSWRRCSKTQSVVCHVRLFAVITVIVIGAAEVLQADDIHPVGGSTTDTIGWGSISNVIDGVIDYDSFLALGALTTAPFGGPYTVTFDLGGEFDLTGMYLWNNAGSNELDGEGIDGFTLSFLSSSSGLLGTFNGNATDTLAMQSFAFLAADVAFVDLTITSNHNPSGRQYAAFHEISFMPEPATLSLLALGLGALAIRRRRKA